MAYQDLQQLPYTEAVLYEALRMYPPAVLTPRISLAPTKACSPPCVSSSLARLLQSAKLAQFERCGRGIT